jgi:hypothetical protein
MQKKYLNFQKQTEKITLLKTTGMALVSAGTFYSKRGVVDTTLCNEVVFCGFSVFLTI